MMNSANDRSDSITKSGSSGSSAIISFSWTSLDGHFVETVRFQRVNDLFFFRNFHDWSSG